MTEPGDEAPIAEPEKEEESAAEPEEVASPAAYKPEDDPTPLDADQAVRIGTLDNGITYYLRHNENPGQSLSLRLVVNAGSLNEAEPGQGVAHFLEHMLFDATEDYPGDSLNATLRTIGAEIGPDLNAHVGYEESVYELALTTDAPENVPTAFHVLSQMAHAATLDPDAVVGERGVVLDELRTRRNTSYGYVAQEFDRIYLQGTSYMGRDPLGTEEAIESMTADDLRTFYETWYVPSNLALVAVGDWPVDEIEALVAEYFGPIPAGDPVEPLVAEASPDPELSVHVVTDEAQGFSYISLDIPIPPVEAGSVGGQRRLVMESLIRLMITNRLEDAYYRGELTQVDRPTFVTFALNRALRYYGTNWQGEDLDTASSAFLSVLLTAQEHGFTDADLTHAVDELAAESQHELDRAATINDSEYAQRYTEHYLYGADMSAAEERHARTTALLDEMTAEELTAHYRWLMERAGPIVIAVGPDADSVPTVADLEAAMAAAAPRSEPPPIEPDIEELMALPEPAAPVASGPLPVLEGVEWRFANGARVMFVQSDIAEGTVDLRARALGGWSQLEPGSRALSARAVDAVLGSGFGDLTKPQINRFVGERTATLNAVIGETVEGFDGRASSDDIETLFQLMHLLITAPRVDDTAFEQALNEAEIRTSLAEVNPAWQALVAYNEARYDEAWHHPVATREQLDSLTAETLLSLYERRFAGVNGMVVAVVGDIDVAIIERLAAHYIGTLPGGGADTYTDRRPPAPVGVVRRRVMQTEDMSAVLEIYHEAEGPVTPHLAVTAEVLRGVLDDRLFRLVREELGASYTAFVSIDPVHIPRPAVLSDIVITGDPDRLEEIHTTTLAILDDLATHGPTGEELGQAISVAEVDYGYTTNSDLLGVLTSRLYIDDEHLLTPRRALDELAEVTADDVRVLAADLYANENRIEIVRAPES